ncbi:LRR receptor-like serine threonine-protein kinase [Seminavis robusta]|uniref:LRR receptor-like serine threonine-protein kinase n=1 Tax=Seminavis robusta TaxID=568900 RepID=A0A9N8GZF7_9STRA|nr:LRR receptor-like serine threonine-protein kinase [Seminavis robusta]|eukprot:Sro3_g002580.1 LRR receptor-like serine threonine-protein kinase (713) ;mRNA; f:195959-198182
MKQGPGIASDDVCGRVRTSEDQEDDGLSSTPAIDSVGGGACTGNSMASGARDDDSDRLEDHSDCEILKAIEKHYQDLASPSDPYPYPEPQPDLTSANPTESSRSKASEPKLKANDLPDHYRALKGQGLQASAQADTGSFTGSIKSPSEQEPRAALTKGPASTYQEQGKATSVPVRNGSDGHATGIANGNTSVLPDQRSLGQPAISTATTVSLPGAYAVAPPSADTVTTDSSDDEAGNLHQEENQLDLLESGLPVTSNGRTEPEPATIDQAGLVVAHMVHVDDENQRIQSLPRATLEERTVAASNDSPDGQKENRQFCIHHSRRCVASITIFTLIFIGIVLIAVLVVKNDDDKSKSKSYRDTNANATIMTTKEFIMSILPNYTRHEVLMAAETPLSDDDVFNMATPQAKALDWILQDPFLNTYLPNRNHDSATISSNQYHQRFFQRFALATIYHATNGPNWQNNQSWLSYDVHECHWFAKNSFAFDQPPDNQMTYMKDYHELIHRNPCELPYQESNATTAQGNRNPYKHLWLHTNELDGTLPLELYWLTSLRSLSLYSNDKLHGSLSSHIGQLSNLEAIAIAYNSMTGSLPTALGALTKLHFLAALHNQFTGIVPSELGLLHRTLQSVFVDGSSLTGTIPDELYDLTLLKTMYLSNNQLAGTISARIGQLTNMWDFQLQGNRLKGTIPSQAGQLQSLKRLMLYENDLTGTLCT